MQGHYKDFWTGTVLLLFYVALLLDAVVLLWGYQVGLWLRRVFSVPQRKDGQ
ncbi:MAG TPA: hypothetical protein VI542_16730 [Candidatus Tectomicrobia bacterium]